MVRKAEFECPCCGGSVRAWYQSNAAAVTCPICRRDIDIRESSGSGADRPHHGDILEKVWLLHGVWS